MNRLIAILAVLAFLYACQSGGGSKAVIKTSAVSGYSYKHFTSASTPKPNIGDFVFFNMDIFDGRDSLLQSYRNQKVLPSIQIVVETDVNRIKNPMVDVLTYLSLGDSAAIIVPVDSVPSLPPGLDYIENLEYHLVVEEIVTEDVFNGRMEAEKAKQQEEMDRLREMLPEVETLTKATLNEYKSGSLSLEETPNGVKYHIHERGTGDMPTDERMVTMQYYGMNVSNGLSFDNSFKRGRGFSFRLGRDAVIQGWHEAARYLPVGTTASLFIPAELGYGATGSPPNIPANEELYFYVIVEELFY